MEKKCKAIIIGTKDFKEKDKIITLFSVEFGLINLLVKSVKNSNAKLKYATELFSFGEFIYNENNGYNILISCEIIDSFFELVHNPDKYFEACAIIFLVKSLTKYGQQDVGIFLELTKSIKTLCYDEVQKGIVICKFLTYIFEDLGYKLSLYKCAICGENFYGKHFLLLDTGEIVCNNCIMGDCLEISPLQHSNLRILCENSYEKLKTLQLKNLSELFNLLSRNFEYRFDFKIKFYC